DLIDLTNSLDSKHYTHKSLWLNDATIGEHLRHAYAYYFCLIQGGPKGIVNYENRVRDFQFETQRDYAIKKMKALVASFLTLETHSPLIIISQESSLPQITSSMARELIYCLDHTIHHQALIKIGLKELGLLHLVSEKFGVAYSTLRYRAHRPT
ncbi:MAG: hypothetical protein ACPH03_02725, partial [Flavobacteriaceae bacterium]